MDCKWQIEIRSAEEGTGDGGFVITIQLAHMATGIVLAANIVEWEGESRIVDALVRDDLSLPSAVARRMIGKVYDNFVSAYPR